MLRIESFCLLVWMMETEPEHMLLVMCTSHVFKVVAMTQEQLHVACQQWQSTLECVDAELLWAEHHLLLTCPCSFVRYFDKGKLWPQPTVAVLGQSKHIDLVAVICLLCDGTNVYTCCSPTANNTANQLGIKNIAILFRGVWVWHGCHGNATLCRWHPYDMHHQLT